MENYNYIKDQDTISYDMAVKKVKRIKGFYTHLFIYLLVNGFIVFYNIDELNEGESYFQFHNFTTAFFWGIGLAIDGFTTFVPYFIFGKDWEERKVRQLMEKDKNSNWE